MNTILPGEWILQCDKYSKHKSKESLTFYVKYKIRLIKWPAYSSDLNPSKTFKKYQHYLEARTFSSIASLKREIEDKWSQIDQKLCRRHIDSVRRRVNILIYIKGALTEY